MMSANKHKPIATSNPWPRAMVYCPARWYGIPECLAFFPDSCQFDQFDDSRLPAQAWQA